MIRAFIVSLAIFSICCAGKVPAVQTASPQATAKAKHRKVNIVAEKQTEVDHHKVPLLRFNDEVSEDSAEATAKWMRDMVDDNAEALIIEWNSPGGSVGAGFELAKSIENSPVPVICVVDGMAASMAFYILQSCDVRAMTRRSVMMAHEPSIGGAISGTPNEFAAIAEMMIAMRDAMVQHMVARMNCTAAEMHRRIDGGQQWWFGYKDAWKYRAVDLVTDSTKEFAKSYRQDLLPPPNVVR